MRAFQAIGFEIVRIDGSHHIMAKAGHFEILSVPVHSGKDLKRGTLRSLIKKAGISVERFRELL